MCVIVLKEKYCKKHHSFIAIIDLTFSQYSFKIRVKMLVMTNRHMHLLRLEYDGVFFMLNAPNLQHISESVIVSSKTCPLLHEHVLKQS